MNIGEDFALLHARTTFQRLSDAKLFTGWVRELTAETLVVDTFTVDQPQRGDTFAFEIHGKGVTADTVATLDLAKAGDPGPFSPIKPRNGCMISLECNHGGSFAVRPSRSEARFWAYGISVEVARESRDRLSAEIIDIGPESFSLLLPERLKKGEIVSATLAVHGRRILCSAQVRNCIGKEGCYRVGLRISSMGGLDETWWKQLYNGIVERNRVKLEFTSRNAA
jgi:hypothetical protein